MGSTGESHPFSTYRTSRHPIDLDSLGYLEEEYLLHGTARAFDLIDGTPVPQHHLPYTTRVLVRRPTHGSTTAWLSILNASQGYDIEDDWRRAWDTIIERGDTYVGITAKPINVDALINYDPARYERLTFGGPSPGLSAGQDWDPFQVLAGCEESLAWEIIAQTARWVRSSTSFPAPAMTALIGQSQSGMYANTYAAHFHNRLSDEQGRPLIDAYLPGAAGMLGRPVAQQDAPGPGGGAVLQEASCKAPTIRVSTDADTCLFGGAGFGIETFRSGDGPFSRHWHVAATPHSDARSRVIPVNAAIEKARRLPRTLTQQVLDGLDIIPVEPVISAAMAALVRWVLHGAPAPPSMWFDAAPGPAALVARDPSGAACGGIRYGMVTHPVADVTPASAENPVIGSMRLHPPEQVLSQYPSAADYRRACDQVDLRLLDQGYLTRSGLELLHEVEDELYHRAVRGTPAAPFSPQGTCLLRAADVPAPAAP